MRAAGYALFLIGLTVASWFGARFVPSPEGAAPLARLGAWFTVAGLPFLGGLAAMIVGGLLARRASAAARAPVEAEHHEGPAGLRAARAELVAIAAKVEALSADQLQTDPKALADTIDHLLEEDVPSFLEHRQTLIDELGLERFAELIGRFAVMERSVARAWSAITDEVYSEVEPSLDKAKLGIAAAAELA